MTVHQPTLWDAPPSARGSKTSAAAARAIAPKAAKIREEVRAAIAETKAYGRTRHEIAERTGIPLATVCSSVSQLLKRGEIKVAPVPRESDTGRQREVLLDVRFAAGWSDEVRP